MEIAELPIPPDLAAGYARRGITELYPPQAACVEAGLFSGKNLLVAIPTASGKTLVAEMAMHHQVGGEGGRQVPLHRSPASAREREVRGVLGGEGSPHRDRHRRLRSKGRVSREERHHRRDEREGGLAPAEPDAVARGDQPARRRRGPPHRRPIARSDA